jgi:hypothetical protein
VAFDHTNRIPHAIFHPERGAKFCGALAHVLVADRLINTFS